MYNFALLSNYDSRETNNLSPTVQLDFSWAIEMSNWQKNWFTRLFESLRSIVKYFIAF